MEAVLGLALLVVMATALAVVSVRHRKVSARMAERRALVRMVEHAVAEMRMSRAPAGSVIIRPVRFEAGVEKMAWAEVVAEREGQRASLIALVPRASIPGEADQ